MIITNPGLLSDARFEVKYLDNYQADAREGEDVIRGLTSSPKTLPPKYFYDSRGSELFERICELPEYYLTRTETAILVSVCEEIASITGLCELVELGSGNSQKTRLLLSAYENLGKPWRYIPIDVSRDTLYNSALKLFHDYPLLSILGLVGTYEQALLQLPSPWHRRMLIFLGSTLGNFTPEETEEFFGLVRQVLNPGDYFLLGIDLQKPIDIVEKAYNDSQGITAAFNLNILSHLNWRFEGNFNLALFEHQAIYNHEKHQIEMYLQAVKAHTVVLNKLDLEIAFKGGDRILTEISRKFDLQNIMATLGKYDLKTVKYWTDKNQWFALILTQINTTNLC
ncbi:MAG: L-histidine N(alpha)-methyltransferase [Geminocystis sp.]|nr:L-histidine N(alpha)-methyltransferase [Geminocystis sp.]MCS7146894.1 L-histidine N(alpha)-methyltransferase [Geminocystis sp.]MDW8115719.1 L-histidine N(alpha)-methyltransferase [Geminocystis sp.]